MNTVRKRLSIAGRHLSQAEDDLVWQIELLMSALYNYVEEFGLAVEMFNENRPHSFGHGELALGFFKRSCICAKAAAITLFNFQETLDALRKMIRKSPFVMSRIDDAALSAAFGTFRGLRKAAMARHAVSHAAEEMESPERMKKNSLKEANKNIPVHIEGGAECFVGLSLSGSVLTMPYNGNYHSIDVSKGTHRCLTNTCEMVFGVLQPVDGASQQLPMDHVQNSGSSERK